MEWLREATQGGVEGAIFRKDSGEEVFIERTPAEKTYLCDQFKCLERGRMMCSYIESENYKDCPYYDEPKDEKISRIRGEIARQ